MSVEAAATEAIPARMFMCTVCGWLYEEDCGLPDEDIPPGTRWEDLPADFVCPDCGVGPESFQELE